MINGSLARRYARALMQIGVETHSYEKLGREVRSLADAIESSQELAATLSNPAFPRDEREKVLRAILQRLGATTTVINFTRLLLDRERLAALPDIARELDVMIDDKAGRASAVITSATPLSPAQEQAVIKSLEALSGKRVHAEKHRDPALLGGVVAQVGDLVYDGSLRTQLNHMRQTLAK